MPLSVLQSISGCQLVCTSTDSCYNPLLLHNLLNGASVDMEILPPMEHPQEINSGFPIWMTNALCNRLHYIHIQIFINMPIITIESLIRPCDRWSCITGPQGCTTYIPSSKLWMPATVSKDEDNYVAEEVAPLM